MLRKPCGLSVAELSRITETSRNTIYALERGSSVRRSTVIAILRAMSSHDRCGPVRKDVRNELRRLNIREPETSRVEQLFEQLRGLRQHLNRLDSLGNSAPEIIDLNSFEDDWNALIKAGSNVIREQRNRRELKSNPHSLRRHGRVLHQMITKSFCALLITCGQPRQVLRVGHIDVSL